MAKLVSILCFGGRALSKKDQPSDGFEFAKIDEAFAVAQADLEAYIISRSLVTTFAYVYSKIIDVEAITDTPVAILSYKPSFNFTQITEKQNIEKFMKGM